MMRHKNSHPPVRVAEAGLMPATRLAESRTSREISDEQVLPAGPLRTRELG